ncbi:T9SS type A sorting domain-containing protein [candidate division WOR-3 bacterium]|nr:T9SS type A sorting domain-containing protein [candidate division WOR-3 bacterium]
MQQTADGGYVIAGSTTSYGSGANDVWLIKTDASGEEDWTLTYGISTDELGYSVRQTLDGGYAVAGCERYSGDEFAVLLFTADADGEPLRARSYGDDGDDVGRSILQTADSGYVIAGWTRPGDTSASDVWLIRTNARGDTLWTRTYGGASWDEASSVQLTADSGYVIVGTTGSFGAGYGDVYAVSTDSEGDTLWTRTWGGVEMDRGWSAAPTADRGFIIVGSTESSGVGSADVWLIKTDSLGMVGVEEPGPTTAARASPPATIARSGDAVPIPRLGADAEVLDVSGRVVARPRDIWSTTGVAPGAYFIRVSSGSLSVTRKVLVVE